MKSKTNSHSKLKATLLICSFVIAQVVAETAKANQKTIDDNEVQFVCRLGDVFPESTMRPYMIIKFNQCRILAEGNGEKGKLLATRFEHIEFEIHDLDAKMIEITLKQERPSIPVKVSIASRTFQYAYTGLTKYFRLKELSTDNDSAMTVDGVLLDKMVPCSGAGGNPAFSC